MNAHTRELSEGVIVSIGLHDFVFTFDGEDLLRLMKSHQYVVGIVGKKLSPFDLFCDRVIRYRATIVFILSVALLIGVACVIDGAIGPWLLVGVGSGTLWFLLQRLIKKEFTSGRLLVVLRYLEQKNSREIALRLVESFNKS